LVNGELVRMDRIAESSVPVPVPSATGASSLAGARVLIVIGPLVLGGAERQAILLASQLGSRFGASVEIWAIYWGSEQLVPYLESAGVRWRMVPAPVIGSDGSLAFRFRQFKKFVGFVRALNRERFDVLMPFMTEPSIVVSLARIFCFGATRRAPCIWNERKDGSEARPASRFRAAVLASHFASYFVANSEVGAEFVRRELGARPDNVRVILNGVALAPALVSREEWRSKLGARDEDIVATMVGNLHQPKDQATLVRAWRVIVDACSGEGRRCILVLAGRFVETHEAVGRLVAELDLGDFVHMLGAVKDVGGLLGASDIGVFSSRNEGTPNGVLECMAAGLPVVAVDLPGIRDALGDDAEPILVPVGDASAMAARVLLLVQNPEERARRGRLNRDRIETHFSPDRMASEFAAVISDLHSANVSKR
jgi:glycosyltransferase involved in cell wall biosynthesis